MNNKEIKKIEPSVLSGFMELLPAKQILFNKFLDSIKKTYESFGFIPLDTPLIEKSEILLAKAGGETEKQIYRFKKGENDLALRFDLTVPLARYAAMHYPELQFPFRRYHIGKVYRGERAQKGRFREFYQCDADIIGAETLDLINDAEMIGLIYETFKELQVGEITIKINNRKILNGFFEYLKIKNKTEVLRIVDKLEKIGADEIKKELSGAGLKEKIIEQLLAFIEISGNNQEMIKKLESISGNEIFKAGVKELKTIIKTADSFNIPEKVIKIDFKIARGLDYYTGAVYETFLNAATEIGSVCSGGRYDNLAECYTDKKLPGVGISIGLTRLFSKLEEAGLINSEISTPAKALVIPLDNLTDKAIKIVAKLHENKISSFAYLEKAKPGKILKYASRLGIPFAVIIGKTEIEQNAVSLKNMKTGEQLSLSIEKAIEQIIKNS